MTHFLQRNRCPRSLYISSLGRPCKRWAQCFLYPTIVTKYNLHAIYIYANHTQQPYINQKPRRWKFDLYIWKYSTTNSLMIFHFFVMRLSPFNIFALIVGSGKRIHLLIKPCASYFHTELISFYYSNIVSRANIVFLHISTNDKIS